MGKCSCRHRVSVIVAEQGDIRRSLRIVDDHIFDMGAGNEFGVTDEYTLARGSDKKNLAKHFDSVLPQADISKEQFPYLEAGAVYKSTKTETYIFVLDNGFDVLIGTGRNTRSELRAVQVQGNYYTDKDEYYLAFVEFSSKKGERKSSASWYMRGETLVLQSRQIGSGRYKRFSGDAGQVLTSLKKRYGFWVED